MSQQKFDILVEHLIKLNEGSAKKIAIPFDETSGDKSFTSLTFNDDMRKVSRQAKPLIDNFLQEWKENGSDSLIFEYKNKLRNIDVFKIGEEIRSHIDFTQGEVPIFGVQVRHRNPSIHLIVLRFRSKQDKSKSILVWVKAFDNYDNYEKFLDKIWKS